MTTYYARLKGTAFCDSDRAEVGSDNTNVTDWPKASAFIYCVAIGRDGRDPPAETFTLQWRVAGGSFANLAATGALKYTTATTLTNGNALTSGNAKVSVANMTWQNGEEVEDGASGSIDLGNDYYTEIQYAVDPSGATASATYEFQVVGSVNGALTAETGSMLTVTMASATVTRTLGADGLLNKTGLTLSPGVDALLNKAGLTSTASLDGCVNKSGAQTASMDAVIYAASVVYVNDIVLEHAAAVQQLALDALLNKTGQAGTLSIDAMVQSALSRTGALDAYLQRTIPVTISADALVNALRTLQASVDAYLQASGASTGALDALLQVAASKITSLDALLNRAGVTASHSLDALLNKAGISVDAGLDAILTQYSVYTRTASLDALVNESGLVATLSLDALAQKTQALAASLDAIIYGIGEVEISAGLDALVMRAMLKSLGLDALVAKSGMTTTVQLDAWLQQIAALGSQLDALITKSMGALAGLDAVLAGLGSYQIIGLDTLISKGFIRQTSVDAIVYGSLSYAVNLDGLLQRPGSASATLMDAIVYSALAAAFPKERFTARVPRAAFIAQERSRFTAALWRPTFVAARAPE